MATLDNYAANKIIDFAIEGRKTQRPLLALSYFPDRGVTYKKDVNYDIGFDTKNLLGNMNVNPEIDIDPVKLPDFATGTLYTTYTKETVVSPSLNEIDQRDFGMQQSTVATKNLALSYMQHMREQLRLAYERMENMHEWICSRILLDGKVTLASKYAPTQFWDFNRKVLTSTAAGSIALQTAAADLLFNELVPEVDLTTYVANLKVSSWTRGGGLSWDSVDATNPTVPVRLVTTGASADLTRLPTPVKDLQRMLEIARWNAGTDIILMTDKAYSWLIKDVRDNYKETFDKTLSVTDPRIALEIIPKLRDIEGLDFRMMWNTGNGVAVPIYTYRAVYFDPALGRNAMYMPDDGTVLLVPSNSYGHTKYGRVEHQGAKWNPMKTYINSWSNPKTQREEWELHRAFVHFHTAINSVVKWKVCTNGAR